jgi:hypothetical protein
VLVKLDDLIRMTTSGWVKCCGEEMTLFQATQKPAAAPRVPPKK